MNIKIDGYFGCVKNCMLNFGHLMSLGTPIDNGVFSDKPLGKKMSCKLLAATIDNYSISPKLCRICRNCNNCSIFFIPILNA